MSLNDNDWVLSTKYKYNNNDYKNYMYSIIKKKLALYQQNLTPCQKNLAPVKKIDTYQKKLALFLFVLLKFVLSN